MIASIRLLELERGYATLARSYEPRPSQSVRAPIPAYIIPSLTTPRDPVQEIVIPTLV